MLVLFIIGVDAAQFQQQRSEYMDDPYDYLDADYEEYLRTESENESKKKTSNSRSSSFHRVE